MGAVWLQKAVCSGLVCQHWGPAGRDAPQGPAASLAASALRTQLGSGSWSSMPRVAKPAMHGCWHAAHWCCCFVLLHATRCGSLTTLCPLAEKVGTQAAMLPTMAWGTQQSRVVILSSSPMELIHNPLI